MGKFNSSMVFCSNEYVLITNTVFLLPNRTKTSWMHPRSKHLRLIQYVIVRRKDRYDVKVKKKRVEQTTDWLSAYSVSESLMYGNHNAGKLQRDSMSPSKNQTTRDKLSSLIFATFWPQCNSSQRIQKTNGQYLRGSLFGC